MGFFAIIKFLIPVIIDGIKEITIPREQQNGARTTIGIRVCILIIISLLLLLGFTTDKLYIVHTEKVTEVARVTILNERLTKCNEQKEKSCILPPYMASEDTVKPHTEKQHRVQHNTPPDLSSARAKMIYEINSL